MYKIYLIALFIPILLKADEIKKTDHTFEVYDDSISNDKTQKYYNYLITLFQKKIITLNTIENLIKDIQSGTFSNPLKCEKKSCSNTSTLIHYEELEKYRKNHDQINKDELINQLKNFLDEQKESNKNKDNAIDNQKNLDENLFFTKIKKNSRYYNFRQIEEIPEGPSTSLTDQSANSDPKKSGFIESLVEKFYSFFPQNTDEQEVQSELQNYRFKILQLNDDYELATTFMSQRLFAKIMGFNPTYKDVPAELINDEIPFEEILVNGKKIKIKKEIAVSNVSLEDLESLIKALNEGKNNSIKALNEGKKCTYDLISQEVMDYLKFIVFNKYKDRSQFQKIIYFRNLIFSFDEVKAMSFSLTPYKNNPLFDFDGIDFSMSFENNNFKYDKSIELKTDFNFHIFYSNNDFKKYTEVNIFSGYVIRNDNDKIYHPFLNKLHYVRKQKEIFLDGLALYKDKYYTMQNLFYMIVGNNEKKVPKTNSLNSLISLEDKDPFIHYKSLNEYEFYYGNTSIYPFYSGIRLMRKCL